MRKLWYGLDLQPIEPEEAERLLRDIDARRVARTVVTTDRGEYLVSTVFLVLDHCWDDGPPTLWETMVMEEPHEQLRRYRSHEEAVKGHVEVVEELCAILRVHGHQVVSVEP